MTKRYYLFALLAIASCSAPPPPTTPTACNIDDDCAVMADCRTYSCQAGECVMTFEKGAPSTCGPFQSCTMDDDCYGIGPCVAGMCGCNADDDCGSTDCVTSACVNHACVQASLHPIGCPASAEPPDAGSACSSTADCAALGSPPECYAWNCAGSPAACQVVPAPDGTACTASAQCGGSCHAGTCIPMPPPISCVDGG